MHYLSTRGGVSPIGFTEAVMMGLAEDGGLLLPRTIPRIGSDTLASWQQLSYGELAFEIMSRFIDDIPASDLRDIINRSYAAFTKDEVVPVVHQGDLHIMELFHGPTLAFKDVALQFLGNLFEYLLQQSQSVLNIIGATSGDTGSAAIHGVRGKERIRIFIMYPKGRVSEVQEQQMTTVLDDNVFNLALEGSFDEAQAIVKSIFNDREFKHRHKLGAINSINWARVLAQVVYYVHGCIHVASHEKDSSVDFAIPTGNFGDIFAGFIARKMLPPGTIRQLVLATNENDILSRLVNSGDYSLGEVKNTTSPSMDIQAASNFERYLYYLMDSDAPKTKLYMEEFAARGGLDLSAHQDQIRRDFVAAAVSEQEVTTTIADFYKKFDYTLDPHTAVGVKAAQKFKAVGVPMICLATAHPAKFSGVITHAIGKPPEIPESLLAIGEKKGRYQLIKNDRDDVQDYVAKRSLRDT